jgi:hypothetical protein
MAILTHKCPHCLTEHIALKVVAITPLGDWDAIAHLSCPKCYLPSAARLLVDQLNIAIRVGDWLREHGDLADGWRVFNFWPAIPGPSIPDHLPEAVGGALLQAERNYPVEGNEEAAGTMYRKALDVGLKTLAPDVSGTLQRRIDKMVEQHVLTPDLGTWAHQIRLLGNESAHDEEAPDRDELEALRNFTNLALQYLFTLPKMVELRKAPDAAS